MAWISSFNITPFHAHLELCRDTPSLQTLYLCWAKITLDSTLWMWMTKPVLLWLGETCCQMNITERSGKQPVSWDVELPSSVQLLAIPCNAASRQEYGVGCHFLLQLTFLTQELNPGPPHCGQTLYALSHQRSPPDSLKIQLFNQTVLGLKDRMSLCFSSRWRCSYTDFTVEMIAFWCHMPTPGPQTHVSLQFHSWGNSFLGHNVVSIYVDFFICFTLIC